MSEERKRFRIETEAIVIGYAMSRLDTGYLAAPEFKTWEQAFSEAANSLSKPPRTFDNLRDEFDPVHPTPAVAGINVFYAEIGSVYLMK